MREFSQSSDRVRHSYAGKGRVTTPLPSGEIADKAENGSQASQTLDSKTDKRVFTVF